MSQSDTGYIIEFVPMGKSVKVSAMDPKSLTEVSIIGPASAGKAELQRNVLNKLQYVLSKKSDDQSSGGGQGGGSSRGGIIV
ncbi:MAG: hypothetical protein JJ879_05925 [Sneathiella sp.]|nr:hypothetical protein [Sneathiella sp.]